MNQQSYVVQYLHPAGLTDALMRDGPRILPFISVLGLGRFLDLTPTSDLSVQRRIRGLGPRVMRCAAGPANDGPASVLRRSKPGKHRPVHWVTVWLGANPCRSGPQRWEGSKRAPESDRPATELNRSLAAPLVPHPFQVPGPHNLIPGCPAHQALPPKAPLIPVQALPSPVPSPSLSST